MIWDLVVVGGGAAGFFGAITYRQAGGGKTLILERSSEVLGKVRISGGGRCNVTHRPSGPREFAKHYPRGEKALIGPLSRWGAEDTKRWFEMRGASLKTESDGRVFPDSDRSQTIIDCLTEEAADLDIEIRRQVPVSRISSATVASGRPVFQLETDIEGARPVQAHRVLLATGGSRSAMGARLAKQLGHSLMPAVPSLFTFKIKDPRIDGLQGLSVTNVHAAVVGEKRLKASGPLLVTHWGLSGPGILKLSAWGASMLAARDYRFELAVNWLPEMNVREVLAGFRQKLSARQMGSRSPFDAIPKRLWDRLLVAAEIPSDCQWSQLSRAYAERLVARLTASVFWVDGKSLNKDEFVTCGGVALKEIDLKTMESRLCPGLYFAGEVIDVDGLTGGFNFQNAWTTSYHAGVAAAKAGDRPIGDESGDA